MADGSFDSGWVQCARNGEQKAIEKLYYFSYKSVYLTVKTLIRGDEDTVMDIVQDSFIKTFSALNTLADDSKFNAWIKAIARNKTMDWLKKERTILFSEMESEDSKKQREIVDDRIYQLPEMKLDQNETARLVQEILNALVATFLWRAESKSGNSGNNPFVDVASGEWYSDAVLWAVDNGITNGTSATTFAPDTTCTRGQIVTFLYRDMK